MTSRSETSFLAFLGCLPVASLIALPTIALCSSPPAIPWTSPRRERALDELVEAVPVSLLEGGALRLPVVGEDDDLVRPRRVLQGHLDVAELVVELAQRLEGVGALEAGVVRNLVVAREGRVHRRSAAHEVGEHTGHDQVAHEDAERPAHQRVDAAAVPARVHITTDRTEGGDPLEDDLPPEQDERPCRVVAVGEEPAVAGVRLLLRLHPADREDHVLCLTGEQVAAARATAHEQADPGCVPPLDLRAVRWRRAGHHRRRLLLHPAEGGHVVVRAQQDPRLTRTRLRGEIRLPLREPVRLPRPAGHVRRVSIPHRPAQHGQRQPVDLQIDDPRHVGRGDDPLPLRDPLRRADRPHVVGAEENGKNDTHGGDDERGKECPAEVVDAEHAIGHVQLGCDLKDHSVRDQDEEKAEDERQRQSQGSEHRRDDRVEQRDDRCYDERAPEASDVDTGEGPRGHHQGDTRGEPRHDEWEQLQARTIGLPGR